MKNILFSITVIFILILNQSCATFHGGNYQHGVTLSEGNYKYVKKVVTTEELCYFLFWGGNNYDWLLDDMKEDLYKYSDLKDNQDLTNFMTSTQFKWNPIFYKVKIKMTADVIEWKTNGLNQSRNELINIDSNLNKIIENDIIEKKVLIASSKEKFEKIKTYSSCPGNITQVFGKGFTVLKLGDIVFSELYGEYGIVTEIKFEKVLVEFFYKETVLARKRYIKPKNLKKIECPDLD